MRVTTGCFREAHGLLSLGPLRDRLAHTFARVIAAKAGGGATGPAGQTPSGPSVAGTALVPVGSIDSFGAGDAQASSAQSVGATFGPTANPNRGVSSSGTAHRAHPYRESDGIASPSGTNAHPVQPGIIAESSAHAGVTGTIHTGSSHSAHVESATTSHKPTAAPALVLPGLESTGKNLP